MRGEWYRTDSGLSGVVAVLAAAAAVTAAVSAVLTFIASIKWEILAVLAAVVAICVAGTTALVRRIRRGGLNLVVVHERPQLEASQPRQVAGPREQHTHLHFHGEVYLETPPQIGVTWEAREE